MKKFLLFVFAVFAFAACTQNEVEEQVAICHDVPGAITVGFEGNDTRIQLNEAQKTIWTKGDLLSVFYLSNGNQKWEYQGKTGERMGVFKRIANASATHELSKVVLVYPYSANYHVNIGSCNLHAVLPATQHYLKDSYGVGDNLMVAQSEFSMFALKNVCGWIKLQLTGNGEIVESITFRGNNNEQVAGLVYVDTATAELTLTTEMGNIIEDTGNVTGGVGGSLIFDDSIITEVNLCCDEGVTLGEEVTSFYIALPPQIFENGFSVEIKCADDTKMVKSTNQIFTIERNHIQPMSEFKFVTSDSNDEPEEPNVPEEPETPETPDSPDTPELPTPSCTKIWYTATEKVIPYFEDEFGATMLSNDWDSTTGEGVMTFDGNVTKVGYYAFYECNKLSSITIPESVTEIGDYAFYACNNLTSITTIENVTEIGKYAFYNCAKLGYLTDMNKIVNIGEYAFYKCTQLTNISSLDNIESIGTYAFNNCDNLISVILGDNIQTIDTDTFSACDNLTSVTIGAGVKTIKGTAFYNCTALKKVYCKAITPPTLDRVLSSANQYLYGFDGNATGRRISVPTESVDAYKTKWSKYADAISGYDF